MATAIHHGAPGSFKSFALVQRFGIDALKDGRTVVTNVRGFNSLDRVKQQFPKIVFPDSAQIIFCTSETKLGRQLMASWFHWVPLRSLILMDEGQRIYPDRRDFKLESLDKVITPPGYDVEHIQITTDDGSIVYRPEDVFTAFDMQRHFQWDIYISTTNIKKIQPPIREVSQYGYFHKSLQGKLPGFLSFLFKNSWYEFKHDAEKSGKTKAEQIGNPIKYNADTRIFNCYQSTVTGEHSESKADQSILSDSSLRIKLGAVFIALALCIFFLFRFSSSHAALKIDKMLPETSTTANISTPVSSGLVLSKSDLDKTNHDAVNNVSGRENFTFSHKLGFEILAIAHQNLNDLEHKTLSFWVSFTSGFRLIQFQQLQAFGYQISSHGLCNLSLIHYSGDMINVTCSHSDIDHCSAVVSSDSIFSQRDCKSPSVIAATTSKVSNAISSATNNYLRP